MLVQNLSGTHWTPQNILVSRLVPDHAAFGVQPEHGIPYNANEFVTFGYNTTTPTTTVSLFEIKMASQFSN